MEKFFLEILKAALSGSSFTPDTVSPQEKEDVLRLAQIHRVLPLVYDILYTNETQVTDTSDPLRRHVKLLVSQQTQKTAEFLTVYSQLSAAGLKPLVVKGIICRSVFPKPDFRISSDEDLLISPDEYDRYCGTLVSLGFTQQEKRTEDHYQTAFISSTGLRLELHTSLFNNSIELFDPWNGLFEKCTENAILLNTDSTPVYTLSPTDHLLYLILHALKHFIHSGVGIRQVCDIVMFSNSCISEIDWEHLFSMCERVNALKFAAGIFTIGRKHLNLSDEVRDILSRHKVYVHDESALLQDILSAGIYGSSTQARQHSATITLNAASGKKENLLRKAFPKSQALTRKYAYAKRMPLLLPVAWGHRLLCYRKETADSKSSALEFAQIGKERLELLKEYGLTQDR